MEMKTSNQWQVQRRSCESSRLDKTVNNTQSVLPKQKSQAATVFAALVLSAFTACSTADSKQQQAQAAAPRSVSVAVAKVQQQDVPVYLVGLGSVTAFYTANIKSRVDGQIMRVNFQEGQVV